MAKHVYNGVTIECVQGNIVDQPDMGAIVNAANAELRTGGGVAGTIHRSAGPELEAECRQFAPIRPGEAVISGAHYLPNRYIIHCLGPVYGVDEPSDKLLGDCYRYALRLADENGVQSIAFPAISTGIFGYPLEPAASIAIKTTIDTLPGLINVKHVRFVLFSDADHQCFTRIIKTIAETG
ncbi:MAG: macro domain-containing protein [Nitrosomonas sp.]|nr:macro domain-containing protein [Nitrosomonas sp.]